MELFRERGYERTSMRMIAERLGLSRSSVYQTFGDKRRAIEQARAPTRPPPSRDPGQVGRLIVSLYLGLSVLVRFGAASERVIDAALEQVEALLPAPIG